MKISTLNKLFLFLYITASTLAVGQSNNSSIGERNSNKTLFTNIGIAFASTSFLFIFDKSINSKFKQNEFSNTGIYKVGHTYGEAGYAFILGAAMYSTNICGHNEIGKTGKMLLEALAISSLSSISLKYILGRTRPNKTSNPTKFEFFETNNKNNSLPSGHVITAFTISTILSKQINNNYASVFLYGLAGLTAYQRIASNNHWFSDAFLGASLGYLISSYIYDLNSESKKFNVIPFYFSNSVNVNISLYL